MTKGFWAILDQGLFAISNFAVSIVLARWLAPDDYGAFTIAYSIFLVLGTVHSSLLVEPMIVFGSGKYREILPSYFAVLLRGHWLLTAAASLTLGTIGLVLNLLGHRSVGLALLALAAANPCILFLWLVRRSCYIRVELHLAASGGVLYLVLLLAGAFALLKAGWLSSPSAFVLMGAGSVLAALWIKSRLPFGSRERLHDVSEQSTGLRRHVVAQHWAYGRWAVGVGVLSGLMLNVYYIVMPTSHGLESTAVLKALMNLMMPAWQTSMALSTATVPWLVRVRGTREFGTVLRRLLFLCFFGGLCYWLALGLAHEQVIRLLYGGRYAQESRLLWLVGLVPIGTGTIGVLETALRSLERTRQVFQAYVLSSVATCLIGIPLMFIWGPGGAVVGFLLSLAFGIGAMAWSLQGAQARPQEQVA